MADDIRTPLPTDPVALERLARIGQLASEWMAEREAMEAEAKKAPRPRKRTGPKPVDVGAVSARIGHAAMIALSIHRTAWTAATCENDDDKEAAFCMIQEAARSVVRMLDACGQRLGDTTLGYFADDMRDGP